MIWYPDTPVKYIGGADLLGLVDEITIEALPSQLYLTEIDTTPVPHN